MKRRKIDHIIIICFLTLIGLYILKFEYCGFLLYIFSLFVSVGFLLTEIKNRSRSFQKLARIIIIVLITGLSLQFFFAQTNNLMAICISFTMYFLIAGHSKFPTLDKKS